MADLKRALRGAWPGATLEPNAILRAALADLGHPPVSYGHSGEQSSGVPIPIVQPVISGTLEEGETLTVTNGTWACAPTSYTRQWKRDGVNISSATNATYVLVADDLDTTITATITATNANGSGSATSAGVDIPVPASVCLLDLQADELVLSDSDPVTTSADASGLGHDFTQTGSARPTYRVGGGTPYVEFDGVDDWMDGGVAAWADNLPSFTLFVLVRFDALSNYQSPIAKMSTLSTGAGWAMFGGVFYLQADGGSEYYERDPLTSDFGADELWVGEKISNTELHQYRNGVLNDYDPPFTNGTITDFSTTQHLELGRFNTGLLTYTPMHLYAVMIYAPALDATARQAKTVELAARYGITL